MRVAGDALVLRKPKAAPRTGLAGASRKLAAVRYAGGNFR